ncbi:MAG: hypothetical protein QXL15_00460 [Candidatus Korarchaeota archaeon]
MRCEICGRLIIGKHLKVGDNAYCDKCMTLPKCESCGRPAKELREGQCPVCYEIFKESRVSPGSRQCIICNKMVVIGALIDGKWVCRSCIPTIKRCSLCGKMLPSRDEELCEQCKKKMERDVPRLLKCSICNNEIRPGAVWKWRNMYICPSCKVKVVTCHFCGRPMLPQKSGSGKPTCSVCESTAVRRVEELQELVSLVRKVLESMKIKVPSLSLKLASITEMNHIGGINPRRYGMFVKRGDYQGVYILNGLPKNIAIGTISHEIAHAWENINAPQGLPQWIYEGFAEWIAYKVYIKLGLLDEASDMLARGDDYGHWLQKMLAIEDKYGPDEVINVVVNPDRFAKR